MNCSPRKSRIAKDAVSTHPTRRDEHVLWSVNDNGRRRRRPDDDDGALSQLTIIVVCQPVIALAAPARHSTEPVGVGAGVDGPFAHSGNKHRPVSRPLFSSHRSLRSAGRQAWSEHGRWAVKPPLPKDHCHVNVCNGMLVIIFTTSARTRTRAVNEQHSTVQSNRNASSYVLLLSDRQGKQQNGCREISKMGRK